MRLPATISAGSALRADAPLSSPGILVGFSAEHKLASRIGWPVAIGGGTTHGALLASRHLIETGVTGLISFGLAGGLDPALPAGTLVVADAVIAEGQVRHSDATLNARLGGATGPLCLGLDRIVASAAEKRSLARETGAALVDMESGAVAMAAAAAGLPFSVLRAICDPVWQDLPPAALVGLDREGRIAPIPLAWSVLTNPGQIGALLTLARGATAARRSLRARLDEIKGREGIL
jgi:adenosylhomocysteine nucleosidase